MCWLDRELNNADKNELPRKGALKPFEVSCRSRSRSGGYTNQIGSYSYRKNSRINQRNYFCAEKDKKQMILYRCGLLTQDSHIDQLGYEKRLLVDRMGLPDMPPKAFAHSECLLGWVPYFVTHPVYSFSSSFRFAPFQISE